MTYLLTVPLKRGSDTDVIGPLRRWIQATFGSSDTPEDIAESLLTLQKMRQGVVKLTERGESGLNSTSNYLDQITALEAKIPLNEVQIVFKWKDAFDRGGIFGGKISLSLSSIAYERVCVLFNVGAFNSGVAADQNLESTEGLQKATRMLQSAAGIFAHLKDTVVGAIQTDPTPDLEPETLSVVADLMLAQAQEMVTLKAISDNMRSAIVAKLCSQCEDMFSNVMRSMQREAVRSLWDSEWLPNVSGKQAIYKGLAQYHQSKVCAEQKEIGEEIARLEYAKRLLSTGIERGQPGLCNAKEWLRKVDRDLTEAKKNNDFIYHERIPEERTLAAVAKAAVAKPTLPLPARLGNASAALLFDALVPVAVHQACETYESRKTEVSRREVGKLKEATVLMNELLSSMNLPAALEDTKGNELPQSLKDKADSVKDSGGADTLTKLIQELPELLTRNTEILDESERLLKEEKESDEKLRTQYKERWSRTPSDKLTSTFNQNASKYRTIINNATQADAVVKQKFETHRANIEALSGGAAGLQNCVPGAAGSANSVSALPIVATLRRQMEEVEGIKNAREVIEAELKNAKPEMRSVFMDAYQKEGMVPEQISTDSLSRVFGPLQNQVEDSIKSQETLMDEVQKNYEVFTEQRSGNGGESGRDEKMKQLAAAHDAYFELKGNLQEGMKFYNDLTQLLVTFQTKVNDFCFARKTEKDELLKDLTSAMSNLTMAPAPQAPAYHAPPTGDASGAGAGKTPPPRPAPPRPAPPAAAAAPNPYAGAPTTAPSAAAPTQPAGQPPANPYAGAPQQQQQQQPNPYAGAPQQQQQPNPYAGAPPGAYPPPQQGAGAPPQPLPYPVQPNMPYPAQQPCGYNPYGGAAPAYPGYQAPPQGAYPPQGYPPQQPPPQGYQAYPPQQQQPPQYPPQQQPPGGYWPKPN